MGTSEKTIIIPKQFSEFIATYRPAIEDAKTTTPKLSNLFTIQEQNSDVYKRISNTLGFDLNSQFRSFSAYQLYRLKNSDDEGICAVSSGEEFRKVVEKIERYFAAKSTAEINIINLRAFLNELSLSQFMTLTTIGTMLHLKGTDRTAVDPSELMLGMISPLLGAAGGFNPFVNLAGQFILLFISMAVAAISDDNRSATPRDWDNLVLEYKRLIDELIRQFNKSLDYCDLLYDAVLRDHILLEKFSEAVWPGPRDLNACRDALQDSYQSSVWKQLLRYGGRLWLSRSISIVTVGKEEFESYKASCPAGEEPHHYWARQNLKLIKQRLKTMRQYGFPVVGACVGLEYYEHMKGAQNTDRVRVAPISLARIGDSHGKDLISMPMTYFDRIVDSFTQQEMFLGPYSLKKNRGIYGGSEGSYLDDSDHRSLSGVSGFETFAEKKVGTHLREKDLLTLAWDEHGDHLSEYGNVTTVLTACRKTQAGLFVLHPGNLDYELHKIELWFGKWGHSERILTGIRVTWRDESGNPLKPSEVYGTQQPYAPESFEFRIGERLKKLQLHWGMYIDGFGITTNRREEEVVLGTNRGKHHPSESFGDKLELVGFEGLAGEIVDYLEVLGERISEDEQ